MSNNTNTSVLVGFVSVDSITERRDGASAVVTPEEGGALGTQPLNVQLEKRTALSTGKRYALALVDASQFPEEEPAAEAAPATTDRKTQRLSDDAEHETPAG